MSTLAPPKPRTTDLPSLDPPEHTDGHHLYYWTKTLCGAPGNKECAAKGTGSNDWHGEKICRYCSKRLCPTCVSIGRSFGRSGIFS